MLARQARKTPSSFTSSKTTIDLTLSEDADDVDVKHKKEPVLTGLHTPANARSSSSKTSSSFTSSKIKEYQTLNEESEDADDIDVKDLLTLSSSPPTKRTRKATKRQVPDTSSDPPTQPTQPPAKPNRKATKHQVPDTSSEAPTQPTQPSTKHARKATKDQVPDTSSDFPTQPTKRVKSDATAEETPNDDVRNAVAYHMLTQTDYSVEEMARRPELLAQAVINCGIQPANRAVWTSGLPQVNKKNDKGHCRAGELKISEGAAAEDKLVVRNVIRDRGWNVTILPGDPTLTADTIICPTCEDSRVFGMGKGLRYHYKKAHLKWESNMDEADWKYLETFEDLDKLLSSGNLTYRWKSKHGMKSIRKLTEFARAYNAS